MAIVVVQTTPGVDDVSCDTDTTFDAVFGSSPVAGNDVIACVGFEVARTLTRPSSEVTGAGWAAELGPVDWGNDTARDGFIESAEVASGAGTSWGWSLDTSGVGGFGLLEASGLDLAATPKSQIVLDDSSPVSISIDGTSDPAGETLYVIYAFGKTFGSQSVVWTNADTSMTKFCEASSLGGTNFSVVGWYEILDGVRPTAVLTNDSSGAHTAGAILIGIPAAAGAAERVPRRRLYVPQRTRRGGQIFGG